MVKKLIFILGLSFLAFGSLLSYIVFIKLVSLYKDFGAAIPWYSYISPFVFFIFGVALLLLSFSRRKMLQKFVFVLALILIGLVVIPVFVIIGQMSGLMVFKQAKQQLMNTPPPSSQTRPSIIANEMGKWAVYTNNNGKYSFEYPSDYFLYQHEYESGIYLASSKGEGGEGPKFLKEGDVWLTVGTEYIVGTSDVNDVIEQKIKLKLYDNVQKVFTTIGGLKGARIIYISPDMLGNLNVSHYEGLVLKDDVLYKITLSAWNGNSLTKYEKMFGQILSTFTFTNQ